MMSSNPVETKFVATQEKGEVSALLLKPEDAIALLVLGHGAGSTMRSPLLKNLSQALSDSRIATFRYQFPYTEEGRRRINSRPVLLETVRSAISTASNAAPDLPLFAGGHSMSGRMTSLAASGSPLPAVRGIVFFGFPLHPAGKPVTDRAEHLSRVTIPMLFLAGTRDRLSEPELLQPVCKELGEKATLHMLDTADHSFKVLKRSGRSEAEVLEELAGVVADWVGRACADK